MRTVSFKHRNLFTMIAVFFLSLCFTAQAQEQYPWAKQRSQYFQKKLGTTDGQTQQLYEVLAERTRTKEEIQATKTGDAQKKANWQADKKMEDKISSILTREQLQKLKELRNSDKNKKAENARQQVASSTVVPNKWVQNRAQLYKKELGLTDEQTEKVYTELATAAERAKEIRKTTTGDVQKKALWKNSKERNDRVFEILTPQQGEDLKAFWKKEANK